MTILLLPKKNLATDGTRAEIPERLTRAIGQTEILFQYFDRDADAYLLIIDPDVTRPGSTQPERLAREGFVLLPSPAFVLSMSPNAGGRP